MPIFFIVSNTDLFALILGDPFVVNLNSFEELILSRMLGTDMLSSNKIKSLIIRNYIPSLKFVVGTSMQAVLFQLV
jgi:hypothetical protein